MSQEKQSKCLGHALDVTSNGFVTYAEAYYDLLEKYNELRESFVDFVCSGVHNPAPFCKNRCDGCVDNRGWCTYRECNGFNPDGKRKEQT